MIMAMWEKFGTSGSGMGVWSNVGVTTTGTLGLAVGNGIRVGGTDEGGDSVKAGWQAGVRKEKRTVMHKRHMMNFISVSFKQIIRGKSGETRLYLPERVQHPVDNPPINKKVPKA
jgi:hypothetical protein